MAGRGPIPKRSDQRRRKNLASAVDTVQIEGPVEVPELGLDGPHPLVVDLYQSLRDSGQAVYFEPSDWARARLMCHMLDRLLRSGSTRGWATLYEAIQHDMSALMMAESDRRRLRVEIERGPVNTEADAAHVAQMDAYRRAAGQSVYEDGA